MSYIKNSLWAVLAFLTLLLFMIIGWLIGATIGGNHFVDFQAFGLRGYEATGLLGVWIGLLPGAFVAYFIVRRLLP
jgi:hypothetical protein